MKRSKSGVRGLMGTPGKNKKLEMKKKAAKAFLAVEEEKEEEPAKKIWDEDLEKLQLTNTSWPQVWEDMGVTPQQELVCSQLQATRDTLVRRRKLQKDRMQNISVLKALYPDPSQLSIAGSFVHVVPESAVASPSPMQKREQRAARSTVASPSPALKTDQRVTQGTVPSLALNMDQRTTPALYNGQRAGQTTAVLQNDTFNVSTPMTMYKPPEEEKNRPVIYYQGVKWSRSDVWGKVTQLAGSQCRKRTIQNEVSFNQSRALQTWAREMDIRQNVKQALAGTLTRPERDLLMTTCEEYSRRRRAHVPHDPSRDTHPLPAFWKLGETLHGTEDIAFTLTRTEKGYPPDIAVRGCTDSTISHNGSVDDSHSNRWHKCDYMQSCHGNQEHAEGGTIHMGDNLGIDARRNWRQATRISSCVTTDQNVESGTPTNKNASCVTNHRKDKSAASTDVEQTGSSVCKRMYRLLGPCLLVDKHFLFWKGSGDACNLSNTVAKKTLLFMEGKVKETIKSSVVIENEGTTAVQYSWNKLQHPQHFTVPMRKRTQKFYFNDDAGVLCPGERISLPVIFNSDTAGCYTESWTLTTIPVLMGGAQILFTFTGMAVADDEYAETRQQIEEKLQKQERVKICEDIVKETLKVALEVGIEREGQLKDDPITMTIEQLFLEKNPGLYYHRDVISRLRTLRETVTMVTPGSDDEMADIKDTPDSDDDSVDDTDVLCLGDLKQILLGLTGSETADEAEVHAERESRLAELHAEANLLSFPPLEPNLPQTKFMYTVVLGLLQMGVDNVGGLAEHHAYNLGLISAHPSSHDGFSTPTQTELGAAKSSITRKKSKGDSVAIKKATSKQRAGSIVMETPPPIVPPFDLSPGNSITEHVLSAEEREAAEAKYHQRLYIDMYCMLVDSVDTMAALFPMRHYQLP